MSSANLTRGVWGPVTATLDWCEQNYQFSRYIAEMANSFSNVVSIAMALYGCLQSRNHDLPLRFVAGFSAFVLVGLGSFAFHATLLFQAQLADELPMIYAASYGTFMLFDTDPGYETISPRVKTLIVGVIVFDALFSWSYYVYRNPIYHQVVFATMCILTAFRTTYILRWSDMARKIPESTRHLIAKLFMTGVTTFASGFLIWNIDNIFCSTLTRWKFAVGWPLAFLLEGHSWWHVLTGTGSYLQIIGIEYLTLCVKDDYRKYEIGYDWGFFPYIRRSSDGKLKAKSQ